MNNELHFNYVYNYCMQNSACAAVAGCSLWEKRVGIFIRVLLPEGDQ